VRQLNPRNPSATFFRSFIFFNVTREPKVPAPFLLCFVSLIDMISIGRNWGKGTQTPSARRIPHRGATSLGTGYPVDSRAGDLRASEIWTEQCGSRVDAILRVLQRPHPLFEGQCSSGFPNPESRSIGGDFYWYPYEL